MPSYPLCTGAVGPAGINHDGDTCPLHEAPDAHAVYAVLDTVHGPHRVRVSPLLDWREAGDRHEALAGNASGRPVSYPGYEVYGREVKWLCVRSAVDPGWPACGPVLPLIDTRS